jgi:hypothetical protein
MFNEREVYIPWYTYWMGVAMLVIKGISEDFRMFLVSNLMG